MFCSTALLVLLFQVANALPSIGPYKRSTCTITSYTQGMTSLASCSQVNIAKQTVPTGQSLNITGLADGTKVQLTGDITFASRIYWTGNLFTISGGKIDFNGNGHTIDGNGAYYWDGQGGNGGVAKPKYVVALAHSGTFQNVVVKNAPEHAFSVKNPAALVVSGVNFDNSAGAALGHNTDAFDVSHSTDLTITGCTIINQDDCLALNSGTNMVFSNNVCTGGHGISIGSIKSDSAVSGVTITGNTVINSQNGLRIKTYSGATNASVKNVVYSGNTVTGATSYGVIIVQDYTNDGETGTATSGVPIENIVFKGTNAVSTVSGATMVKVLCGAGDCKGSWDWSGLKTTGGKAGKSSNVGGSDYRVRVQMTCWGFDCLF